MDGYDRREHSALLKIKPNRRTPEEQMKLEELTKIAKRRRAVRLIRKVAEAKAARP